MPSPASPNPVANKVASFPAARLDGQAAASPHNGDVALHKVPSHDFFHRKSQELSMAHLVRHPRIHAFDNVEGRFGLESGYEAVRLLGRGGTGQTWLCRRRGTGEEVALKLQQRPLPKHTLDLTYNEVVIQAEVGWGSPHMCTLQEVMLTPTHLAMVLDYEAGGSCAEYVAAQIPKVARLELCVDEERARYMFRQLIAGVEYLHSLHVAHRDIKLDNSLMDGADPARVKLCDFQFAKYWGKPEYARMTTHLGTAVYMAPEVITNRQNHKSYNPVEADVWACGIWLVALLVGAFPFDNRPGVDDRTAEMQILHQEMSAPWHDSKFVRPYIGKLSPGCMDLLDRTLAVDPRRRISLGEISAHPWLAAPLAEPYAGAWEACVAAQRAARERMARLPHDPEAVMARNGRVFALVQEAGRGGDAGTSHERLATLPALPMVDAASMPHVVRVDMRPEAVRARAASARVRSLLDVDPDGEGAEGGEPAAAPAPPPRKFRDTAPGVATKTPPSTPLAGAEDGGSGAAKPSPFATTGGAEGAHAV